MFFCQKEVAQLKELELTPRLQAVADLVPPNAALADVGTDHAYLPAWLLGRGRVRRAIAADINQGPLDRAKLTARQYGCTERMEFRLCDGLAAIAPDEVDTIVIAGMGGETIAAILQAAHWVFDSRYTLILQPMSAQPDLRNWLWYHGFSIQKEQIIREGEKLYNVFVASFGSAVELTCAEEWAGRQYEGMVQPLRSEYLTRLLEKVDRAMTGISRGKSGLQDPRLDKLRQVQAELTEMKKEWDAWQL